MAIEKRVPTSRLGRLSLLGQVAGGMLGGALNEGVSRLVNGNRPEFRDILLTPSNARRLSAKLSEMRGAAMKVGQLMSMDSGQLLPAEFSDVLRRLRDDAQVMPLGQVNEVLKQSLGNGWEKNFSQFVFKPIAAASIGQVHQAVLADGRQVALKIQYPGIKKSIDSDVDNVAWLLKTFRLLPAHLDMKALLEQAKVQLHLETDYLREAELIGQFSAYIKQDQRYAIPEVIQSLTERDVLTMTYLAGEPIESLMEQNQAERNRIAANILELSLKEVFHWGLVQTDPNFANYLYRKIDGVVELLDFGATHHYGPDQKTHLCMLLQASIEGNHNDIVLAAEKVGYLEGSEPESYLQNMVHLLRMVTEPLRGNTYDFGRTDLVNRMQEVFMEMRLKSRDGVVPPLEVLFLHRKLAGIYLLLSKFRATIPVRELMPVKQHLQ